MAYKSSLPPIRKLQQLADWDGPFPIENRYVILAAERFQFDDSVINFLKLFPPNQVFRSRSDFIQRCHKLEALIRSEPYLPIETLHSTQDQG